MDVICWTAATVAENLVLDETQARSAQVTGRHLFRFWWGGPPAVAMGSSERAEQVVDVAEHSHSSPLKNSLSSSAI